VHQAWRTPAGSGRAERAYILIKGTRAERAYILIKGTRAEHHALPSDAVILLTTIAAIIILLIN
jgi:hypothetical protein